MNTVYPPKPDLSARNWSAACSVEDLSMGGKGMRSLRSSPLHWSRCAARGKGKQRSLPLPPWVVHRGRAFAAGSLLNVALVLLCLSSLTGCVEEKLPTHQRVELGGEEFKLELAITDRQRATGLMGRESVPDHGGMLFVFPGEAHRSFWMKNCLIPLDVIFLDGRGRIVSITTMPVPPPGDPTPPTYSSRWPAQFAIELAAGRADQLGLEAGERIDLPLDSLKQLAQWAD